MTTEPCEFAEETKKVTRLSAISRSELRTTYVCSFVSTILLITNLGCTQRENNVEAREPTSASRSPISINHGEPSIHCGVLFPVESQRTRIKVVNNTGFPVSIDSITTSCECVSIEPKSNVLSPNSTFFFDIKYDGQKDSEFRGELAVEIDFRMKSEGKSYTSSITYCVEIADAHGLGGEVRTN